ncbi:MAG: hypothetical protein ACOYN3_05235 [Acidimicrobiia bacterium]
MARRVAVVVIAILVGLLVLTAIAIPANAARLDRASQDLAGGGTAPPGEVFMVSGGTLDGLFPLVARNVGGAPLAVRVNDNVPTGITITPDMRTATIPAGQTVTIPYSVRLDTNLAPGRYRVEVSVLPANVGITQGTVQFVPAITQRYVIVVSGQAGDLKAKAMDSVENKSVSGTFIASRINGVSRVPIARIVGPTMSARVVPGEYEVAFEVSGKRIASRQVRVNDGKTTETELSVALLQFTEVKAERIELNGQLAAVGLEARFENSLRPLNDAQVAVEVSRNGKSIETVEVQRFQVLSPGTGTISTRYVPRQGWVDGAYEFRFRLIAGDIAIVAVTRPKIQVGPPPPQSTKSLVMLVAIGLGLVVITALLWWAAGRSRRRNQPPPDILAGRRVHRTVVLAGRAEARRSASDPALQPAKDD